MLKASLVIKEKLEKNHLLHEFTKEYPFYNVVVTGRKLKSKRILKLNEAIKLYSYAEFFSAMFFFASGSGLGSSVASILSILLTKEYSSVRCYAYSPAGEKY